MVVARQSITRHRPGSSRPNVNAAVGRRSLRQVDSAIDHGDRRVVGDSGEVAEFRRVLGVGGVKIGAVRRHDRVGRMDLVVGGPLHKRFQYAGTQADPRRRGAAIGVLVERDGGRRTESELAAVGQDDDGGPIGAGNYPIALVNRRARCGSQRGAAALDLNRSAGAGDGPGGALRSGRARQRGHRK